MGRIMAWTPSLTGGIVVVRDPCLHGRFSIGSLCVGPSDTMSWSPTIGLLITPQEPIQPRLGGRVERFPSTFRTEVVLRLIMYWHTLGFSRESLARACCDALLAQRLLGYRLRLELGAHRLLKLVGWLR